MTSVWFDAEPEGVGTMFVASAFLDGDKSYSDSCCRYRGRVPCQQVSQCQLKVVHLVRGQHEARYVTLVSHSQEHASSFPSVEHAADVRGQRASFDFHLANNTFLEHITQKE